MDHPKDNEKHRYRRWRPISEEQTTEGRAIINSWKQKRADRDSDDWLQSRTQILDELDEIAMVQQGIAMRFYLRDLKSVVLRTPTTADRLRYDLASSYRNDPK